MAQNSISNRIAKLDGKSFSKEINNLTKKNKKVNHEENLKRFGKK